MLKPSIIQKLGFDLIKEAEETIPDDKKLSEDTLLRLYSVFGNTLCLAAELLEKCKITQYENNDRSRHVYKIGSGLHRYTIYHNINFCSCQNFREQVASKGTALTCEHVLAIKLNQITGAIPVRRETITDAQFVEFLNVQTMRDSE